VTDIVKRSLLAVCALALAFGVLILVSGSVALAANEYQVRLVATPVNNTTPSFVTASGDHLSWTGSYKGTSKMYVYDLLTGGNAWINPGPSGSYYNPAAEGDYVVFQGSTSGGFDDIYLYNRATGKLKIISSWGLDGDQNDWNPRIQDGRVVWEKDTADPASGSGIYLYDIKAADSPQQILPGPDYRSPDIWGDYVVCVKDVPSDAGPNASQIVLYDLATSQEKTIAEADKNNEHPRIDSGKIVWSSGDVWTPDTGNNWSTSYQICLYDIASGETKVITDNAAGNINPTIGGDLVAWQTWTPSSVQGYSVSSGDQFYISAERGGDTAKSPEIDDTRVAWYGSKGLYYAVPASEATSFPDVPAGHHYLDAIEGVVGKNIMTGYGDGTFGPNDWLIHQQFALWIDLTRGYSVTEKDIYDFTDQPPIVHLDNTLYPYHYVSVATLKGVVSTYSDGTFRPLYRERRFEALRSIVVAGGASLADPPPGYTATLTDSDPVTAQALKIAEYNGLLENIVGPDGTLKTWDVGEPITRAEMAQLLWNLLAKAPPST
jgi:hypothetical protein